MLMSDRNKNQSVPLFRIRWKRPAKCYLWSLIIITILGSRWARIFHHLHIKNGRNRILTCLTAWDCWMQMLSITSAQMFRTDNFPLPRVDTNPFSDRQSHSAKENWVRCWSMGSFCNKLSKRQRRFLLLNEAIIEWRNDFNIERLFVIMQRGWRFARKKLGQALL